MAGDNTNHTKRFDQIDERFNDVDGRLNSVNKQFEEHNKRFDKIDKQFDELTAAMVKGFDHIEKALDKKTDKSDLDRMINMLDEMIKRQETCDQERLVMGHHIERIERWSYELAGQTGSKLSLA